MTITRDQFDAVLSALAQGVINICEGHTTIEADSRIHKAMSKVIEMWQKGELALVAYASPRRFVFDVSDQETRETEKHINACEAALSVLALDPNTRAYLEGHDPKALAQADTALKLKKGS